MIVAIGKFAEARANSAVAGTELKGKIKVIPVHYLSCNTSLKTKNSVACSPQANYTGSVIQVCIVKTPDGRKAGRLKATC
jgi:hypothetical protein